MAQVYQKVFIQSLYRLTYLLLFCFFSRRQFTKRQRIVHSYGDGDADDELNEEEALATVLLHHTQATPEMQSNAGPSTSEPQKKCACGGTDHMRRSSLLCPLNKRHRTQD